MKNSKIGGAVSDTNTLVIQLYHPGSEGAWDMESYFCAPVDIEIIGGGVVTVLDPNAAEVWGLYEFNPSGGPDDHTNVFTLAAQEGGPFGCQPLTTPFTLLAGRAYTIDQTSGGGGGTNSEYISLTLYGQIP